MGLFRADREEEKALINDFLGELEDVFSVAGCNDFILAATPENIALVAAAYADCDPDEIPQAKDGAIYCMNFVILAELRQRLILSPANREE